MVERPDYLLHHMWNFIVVFEAKTFYPTTKL